MGTPPAVASLRPRPRLRAVASRRAVVRTATVWVLGAGIAMAASLAWVLIRDHAPSVDGGLVLVAVTTLLGLTGQRAAVIGAAAGSAAGFTYFDTEPYEHFAITRGSDVATAVLLVVVGLATGELALRVVRQHRFDRGAGGSLGRVREAANRLAQGEELVLMIGAVADQIRTLLGLTDCSFSTEEADARLRYFDREAVLRHPTPDTGPGVLRPAPHEEVTLPVLSQGAVVGRFVLQPGPATTWGHDQLLVAVTLADQVGAALAAQAPPIVPTDPDPGPDAEPPPGPHLRVIR